VSGPVALHGGGEFLAGDEPFLAALLAGAALRVGNARPIRIAIVPTAAARGRPDLAAGHGVAAMERVATAEGLQVIVGTVRVVDAGSAADRALAARLAEADVIHFPGGDPDLIPTIMPGSAAWAAIEMAQARGAILAGASAGAMALAPWTWTSSGGMTGLGVVPGLIVVPHADRDNWAAALERFGAWGPAGLGGLGIGERTGVFAEELAPAGGSITWRIVGPGEVFWQAVQGGRTVVARAGETITTTT
jgi:cyanophycinase-like exopeptidase